MQLEPRSHHNVAVTGGARGNEGLKRPRRLNANGYSTTPRYQRLTNWDRTTILDKSVEILCLQKEILS